MCYNYESLRHNFSSYQRVIKTWNRNLYRTKLKNLPQSLKLELAILLVFSFLVFFLAVNYDALELFVDFAEAHEDWELDEFFTLLMVSSVSMSIFAYRRWREQSIEIQKRKLAEKELLYLVQHDSLTGIPNRTMFNNQVSLALEQQRVFSAMLLDLNKFKKVNDLYGHHVGDLALIEVSNRLKSITREGDLCARLGGDEFVLLFLNLTDKEVLSKKAAHIIEALDELIQVDNYEFELGGSLGIVIEESCQSSVVDILRRADISMYAAKKSMAQRWKFFEKEMDNVLFERQYLEDELKKAIKNREIGIHLQPIYDLRDGRIANFEVLARWTHHQLGEVEPTVFIAVAEETGLIFELGDQVLNQACIAAMSWDEPIPVAVNVSAHQVRHPDFIFRIKRILSSSGLPAERLEVELTESILLEDISRANCVISELKSMGISTALDDFGTGYSSLSYLQALEFDKLKIDREFISELATSDKNRAIVSALLKMCSDMKINLVAEGIETEENLAYLKESECHFGQGFLLGVPSNESSTNNLIKSGRTPD